MKYKILGESQAVKTLLNLIERVSGTKTNILVIGESGTGKELVARMIHDTGPLKDRPFVPVNCGAIPETLIESELFGHRKGSFTGAIGEKQGLFEAANGGTLFLDEVGELPLSMQVKLLRAIQERCFRKVGGTEDVHVDLRIIAATNKDLEACVAKGTFREDLYYRLNVILIRTPPLRERKGDIELLANTFIERFADRQKKRIVGLESDVLALLERYHWPGNVRELENVIERAVTLENGNRISRDSMPAMISQTMAETVPVPSSGDKADQSGRVQEEIRIPAPDFSKGPINLDEILGDIERVYLMKALEHAGGVKKKAAELLGVTFRSMRYRLKKLGAVGHNDPDEEE